jgi:hypothetical protein
MDINHEQLNLKFSILPTSTKKALDFLSKEEWIGNSDWYLAGGTALALQAGHRKSVDLDFFSRQKNFEEDEVLAHFNISLYDYRRNQSVTYFTYSSWIRTISF